MPYMLLLGDIRQGIFYAQLLSFWLVFAGEHMLIQDTQSGGVSTLKLYWKHLSAVIIGCLSLFVFDVCERGAQLRNPFYSIWITKLGANLAVSIIIIHIRRSGIKEVKYICMIKRNNIVETINILTRILILWKIFSPIPKSIFCRIGL